MPEERLLICSCEHGGNRVPAQYRALFTGAEEVLESHRGWDVGALTLAEDLARRFGAPLCAARVTRLLVELNRSPGHPRVFSEFSRGLDSDERQRVLDGYYFPHREGGAAPPGVRRGPGRAPGDSPGDPHLYARARGCCARGG
ncbi:MAG: N-formylglutamate amidohydrolase, partial [Proteobacteria bacterium]|nr:N-formylglutamate amidohydrolase [Pseudomonadota bacterium]